ncbi:hypothetical protein F2P56_024161 [Juglans regia]|uniref:Uncharacterized protein LOC108992011 n=2 Tax=Juglans regia TaxID=51240 RepID=A0A2I4ERF9_JUGRE|nr:uncharacterized protein LOC108992011 [Juglans regia]KAF5454503.1 hypothetical protein F2P56_024161 [Juglans regia]
MVSELHLSKNARVKKALLPPPHTTQWCKAPLNQYKINWDAAIDKVNCRIGIGVIIRDWNGCVSAILRSTCSSFPDPLLGEAIAALSAIKFCYDLGPRSIILKGDSLNVVNAVNGPETNWSSVGMIITDLKKLLIQVGARKVLYVPHESNVVAHCLAKSSLDLLEESIHVEDYPQCIHNLIR